MLDSFLKTEQQYNKSGANELTKILSNTYLYGRHNKVYQSSLIKSIALIVIFLNALVGHAQSGSENVIPDAILNGPPVAPIVVSMPLEKASAIVDEALSVGAKEGMLPLTVVVLDAGGHMVAVKREDGSGIFRIEVANAKAYGALGMGVSTRVMGQRLKDRPEFAGALNGLSGGRWVPVPGGVLIRNDEGQILGSVGISGDTSDRDEYAAIIAIKASGFYSEPLEPNKSWVDSEL